MGNSDRLDIQVTIRAKEAQALALKAMFDYWNYLSNIGASRKVAFYVDGDGDFRPDVQADTDCELPDVEDAAELAVVEDDHGHRVYDYDPIGWALLEDEAND